MKKIDTNFDVIINANVELYSVKLSELKKEVKGWYKDVNLKEFDSRFLSNEPKLVEMKKTGVLCNFFFAYREEGKNYLMDGFNRLFTDYGQFDEDPFVYLKIITDKLEDNHLMSIMFNLNMWKLSTHGIHSYKINEFLDRGMKLFLYSKFGIEFYKYDEYHKRTREEDDMQVMDYFFVNEVGYSGEFKFEYGYLKKIFSNKHIINDFKEILKSNDYRNYPFKNFNNYLHGFIMFLAWRRASEDERVYKFQYYLDKLKEDKKFFKKIQGMAGNDSTRINIFNFLRNLHKEDNEKKI